MNEELASRNENLPMTGGIITLSASRTTDRLNRLNDRQVVATS